MRPGHATIHHPHRTIAAWALVIAPSFIGAPVLFTSLIALVVVLAHRQVGAALARQLAEERTVLAGITASVFSRPPEPPSA
jgi:hypothetical protein